jgi:hypothetical protein
MSGQAPTAPSVCAGQRPQVPRTPDGHLDLQGIWDCDARYGGRPNWVARSVTDQEAAEFETKNRRNQANRRQAPVGVVNGQKSTPTSNGRTLTSGGISEEGEHGVSGDLSVGQPHSELTPEAQAATERREARERPAFGPGTAVSANLASSVSMPPRRCCRAPTTTTCNSYGQRLRGHPQQMVPTRAWFRSAASRTAARAVERRLAGHWEGNTLVIETRLLGRDIVRQFPATLPHGTLREPTPTRCSEFTVTDPTTWTKPWTVQVPMARSDRRSSSTRATSQLRDDQPAQVPATSRTSGKVMPQTPSAEQREL